MVKRLTLMLLYFVLTLTKYRCFALLCLVSVIVFKSSHCLFKRLILPEQSQDE